MTVILLRHGVSTSNTAGTLAGRSPGVELTERGIEQAAAVAERLATLPIEHIATSPLLRCQRTVAPLADKLGIEPTPDERLIEVDYGTWTGRPIKELVSEPLWKTVQAHASGAVFPNGEGLAAVSHRAINAIRDIDKNLRDNADGRDVLWVGCAHGDIIKAILADALGLHLDAFQRIAVEPASVSVVRYGPHGPQVWKFNDTGTDLSALAASPKTAHATPGGEVPTTAATDNGNATDRDSA
ncbi:histidine phosphatase family protein [Nocardia camponoti]|uniref:Phosphoglycerate mutase n=1 Tax=Nocardia camponoti TaxID=1616106 RepID=A0A917Q8J8_9NOCA|nr:histidine phosphatase family protein [Nocardia camponoti]GGK36340.1 phosphoglycerate mutase [Nocardia camponoti]